VNFVEILIRVGEEFHIVLLAIIYVAVICASLYVALMAVGDLLKFIRRVLR